MKEPIIIQTNIISTVRLQDKFDFNASITIGLAESEDFYIVIDFLDLTTDKLKTITELCRLHKQIPIKSDLFEREQYNITHIVITKFSSNSSHACTWICLSDEPNYFNGLIVQ